MKIANFLALVVATCIVMTPSMLLADLDDTHASLMVSRDADGSLSKESRNAMQRLSKLAKKNNHVRVWVTLDVPFDPFLEDGGEQAIVIDGMFDQVLDPLVSNGHIQYYSGERYYSGPSLQLLATARGLRQLMKDDRVGQIVGIR